MYDFLLVVCSNNVFIFAVSEILSQISEISEIYRLCDTILQSNVLLLICVRFEVLGLFLSRDMIS